MEHAHVRSELYKTISRKNIAIFDSAGQFHSGEMESSKEISTAFIEEVRKNHNSFFSTESHFYNGIFYPDNQGDFVVVTREPKTEFSAQLRSLLQILIGVILLGILLACFFSHSS